MQPGVNRLQDMLSPRMPAVQAPAPANGLAALQGMVGQPQGVASATGLPVGSGRVIGRDSTGAGGGAREDIRGLAHQSMNPGPRGSMSQLSNTQLDKMTSVLGSKWTKGVAALLGLLTPVPVGTVMSGVNMLAKHEKNKRGGRDLSDSQNREWGSYDSRDVAGHDQSAGYRDMMRGGHTGVVTSYDMSPGDAYRARVWGNSSEERAE